MGAPSYSKLQDYWNLTIGLFSFISRKLVSVWSYPSAEVQSVYSTVLSDYANYTPETSFEAFSSFSLPGDTVIVSDSFWPTVLRGFRGSSNDKTLRWKKVLNAYGANVKKIIVSFIGNFCHA